MSVSGTPFTALSGASALHSLANDGGLTMLLESPVGGAASTFDSSSFSFSFSSDTATLAAFIISVFI